MSNYRDDTQETAVAIDSTWMGLRSIAESAAKATAVAFFALGVTHADQATVSDGVFDQRRHTIIESARASDALITTKHTHMLVTDTAQVSERYRSVVGVTHTDVAVVADAVMEAAGAMLSDSAKASSEVFGQRISYSFIDDRAQILDASYQAGRDTATETATVHDAPIGTLQSFDLLVDALTICDSVDEAFRAGTVPLVDSAVVSDATTDRLHAADLVNDWILIDDGLVGDDASEGLAWTACVDGWAMSRYAPYTFTRLVVIDGAAYGETDEGVFALSGGNESIEARVTTGRIDMSGGPLTHPVAAYLEYELVGTTEMAVTTTQTGTPATYTYPLPAELAEHLTNGRIQFGRGLRGRHFSFELRMTGQHGCINDLSIQTAQGRRRI